MNKIHFAEFILSYFVSLHRNQERSSTGEGVMLVCSCKRYKEMSIIHDNHYIYHISQIHQAAGRLGEEEEA